MGASLAPRSVAVTDTLLFAWNGRVRSRIPVSLDFDIDIGAVTIDTSTTAADIPWDGRIAYGDLVDSRDRQHYRTVTIGSRTWMAENLNFKTGSSSWASNSADSGALLGRSPRWAQAIGLDDSCDTGPARFPQRCRAYARQAGMCRWPGSGNG